MQIELRNKADGKYLSINNKPISNTVNFKKFNGIKDNIVAVWEVDENEILKASKHVCHLPLTKSTENIKDWVSESESNS